MSLTTAHLVTALLFIASAFSIALLAVRQRFTPKNLARLATDSTSDIVPNRHWMSWCFVGLGWAALGILSVLGPIIVPSTATSHQPQASNSSLLSDVIVVVVSSMVAPWVLFAFSRLFRPDEKLHEPFWNYPIMATTSTTTLFVVGFAYIFPVGVACAAPFVSGFAWSGLMALGLVPLACSVWLLWAMRTRRLRLW